VRKKASANPVVRLEFPTVTWYEPKQHYRIDARAKGGKQHYRSNRDDALALADTLAGEFEHKGRNAFADPVLQEQTLKSMGVTLQEVVERFIRTQTLAAQSKTLEEAFAFFAETKEREKLETCSTLNVLDEVRRFKDRLGTNPRLKTITLATVLNYLTSRANCPSTFNTYRKHLATFFNFLVAHEWIAKNPTKLIPLKKETFDVKVLRPETVGRLLNATYSALSEPASSCMRAYLALATFMGIRPEEILKLDWKDINLETGQIYISKLVSKTGDDREVPIFRNAKAWLLTCVRNGAVCPKSSFNRRLLTLREAVGIQTWRRAGEPWGHDILRHTFGSSWLAIHKNRPMLAEIMGNSVPVITKHYKRTLSVAQAEALFAIMPPAEALVTDQTRWG